MTELLAKNTGLRGTRILDRQVYDAYLDETNDRGIHFEKFDRLG